MTSEQLDEIRMLAACRDLSPDERAAIVAALATIAALTIERDQAHDNTQAMTEVAQRYLEERDEARANVRGHALRRGFEARDIELMRATVAAHDANRRIDLDL